MRRFFLSAGTGLIMFIFLASSLLKLFDLNDFLRSVRDFRLLDGPLLAYVAAWVPSFELICVIALAYRPLRRAALAWLFVLLVVFSLAWIQAYVRGFDPDCGCFGKLSFLDGLPLLRNLFLLLLLWWLNVQAWRLSSSSS